MNSQKPEMKFTPVYANSRIYLFSADRVAGPVWRYDMCNENIIYMKIWYIKT